LSNASELTPQIWPYCRRDRRRCHRRPTGKATFKGRLGRRCELRTRQSDCPDQIHHLIVRICVTTLNGYVSLIHGISTVMSFAGLPIRLRLLGSAFFSMQKAGYVTPSSRLTRGDHTRDHTTGAQNNNLFTACSDSCEQMTHPSSSKSDTARVLDLALFRH
jgi:hypothetical protein